MSSSEGSSTSKESVNLFSSWASSWRSMVPDWSESKSLKAFRSYFVATSRVYCILAFFMKIIIISKTEGVNLRLTKGR